jgi:uncharacterized protein
MSIADHVHTIAPWLRSVVGPGARSSAEPWATGVPDAKVGPVRLTGLLRHEPGADAVLVVVHGLGGDATSAYVARAARAASRAGISCLRMSLRGADRLGEDYFHAGLTADLSFSVRSPELERYPKVLVVGYSIGGHLALAHAAETMDARVRAVAAICPPLDLSLGATAFDGPGNALYRAYILSSMKRMYAVVARRRAVPIPVREALRVTTIRRWDTLVVAPRHGFRDAEDYYERVSVGPRLGRVAVPTLLVEACCDPLVPEETVRPSLAGASGCIDVRWAPKSGHLGFPSALDLGLGPDLGIEGQLLAWLGRFV